MSDRCKECGSLDTKWHCSHENTSGGVVDGRLCMHDIKTVFFLGCEYCSATLKVIGSDDFLDMNDEQQATIQKLAETVIDALDIMDKEANKNPVNCADYSEFRRSKRELANEHIKQERSE